MTVIMVYISMRIPFQNGSFVELPHAATSEAGNRINSLRSPSPPHEPCGHYCHGPNIALTLFHIGAVRLE